MFRAFVVAAVIAAAAFADDHKCAQYSSCQSCVAQPLCGWCSEKVVYPGNVTGAQCAGFNPDGPNPFVCDGIYSTEMCASGYECSMVNFTCNIAPPGQGTTKHKCEAECYNKGQLFKCNLTTHQCYQVPKGTPGGKSDAECMAACAHPSPHPAPPPPTQTPGGLFACNTTTGQCEQSTAGHGESKEVCEKECTKQNNTEYICNSFLKKCVVLPPGIPGGETLKQCQETCLPHPKPGPPPELKDHTYRGIRIQNGYTIGPSTLVVNTSVVAYVAMSKGAVKESWQGTPSHIPGEKELWVTLTTGANKGKVWKAIFQMGAPGPETTTMTLAAAAMGEDAPASIKDAMTTAGQQVFAFSGCNTPDCHFTLPPQAVPPIAGALTDKMLREAEERRKLFDKDHCAQYGDSCADCIAHEFCGWCSTNVTYKDGTKGSQCAGFNGPDSGSPFVCNGRYSTENCTNGYKCDEKNFQCVPTTPGNGLPKKECDLFCKPTPPPTPPQQQAVCNLTTKQCHPCPHNESHCTGALPEAACEAACSHHKHGPHAHLIGQWRGIFIEQGYEHIEVELKFNGSGCTYYESGSEKWFANVTSLGSDAMLFKILSGEHTGFKFGVLFQLGQPGPNFYQVMTFARGKYAESFPASFAEAMDTQGMVELVINKCEGTPCKFTDL